MSRNWSEWTRPIGVFRVPDLERRDRPWRMLCTPCGRVAKHYDQRTASAVAHTHARVCSTFQIMARQFRP